MGLTEEAAREAATKEGYADKVSVVKTSFKANSKVCHGSRKSVDIMTHAHGNTPSLPYLLCHLSSMLSIAAAFTLLPISLTACKYTYSM